MNKLYDKIMGIISSNGIPSLQKKISKYISRGDNDKITLKEIGVILNKYHKHSFIYEMNNKRSAPQDSLQIIDNGDLITIKCKSFDGSNLEETKKYKKTVQDVVNNKALKNLIIDLRMHEGGTMWPFLHSISPLLDNTIIQFHNGRKEIGKVNIDKGMPKRHDVNIYVIVGHKTSSAGEFIAATLRNNKGVKLFGQDTAGMLSVNATHEIDIDRHKYILVLTEGYMCDKAGKPIKAEYIRPHIYTNTPMNDIKELIKKK